MSTAQNILSSRSSQWFTPPAILDLEREALVGEFDLDPASCADAQKLVRAERWMDGGERGNGLVFNAWAATRMHLNPPYSPKDGGPVDPWIEKAIASTKRPDFAACLVLNATPGIRAWFRSLWPVATIAFLHRRIAFVETLTQALERNSAMPGTAVAAKLTARLEKAAREAGLPEGLVPGPQPTHGNVVAYLGEDSFRFERAFRAHATIIPRGAARHA